MPSTEVIILFIGLTTFSAQIPNECGLKAILPRIHYVPIDVDATRYHEPQMLRVTPAEPTEQKPPQKPAPATAPPATAAKPSSSRAATTVREAFADRPLPTAPVTQANAPNLRSAAFSLDFGNVQRVEDHAAALIFELESYVVSPGWTKTNLPVAAGSANPTPKYGYVLLDGDRVRFVTAGVTTNAQPTLANVVLPPLPQLCSAAQNLRQDYLPPYRGAAAVFDITEGTLESCLSEGTTPPFGERVDSKVTLGTNGTFVVSASTMKVTKELRLKPAADGSIRLAVANVPSGFLQGKFVPKGEHEIDGLPHVRAYYAMGAGNGASCNQTIEEWFKGRKPAKCSQSSQLGAFRENQPGVPRNSSPIEQLIGSIGPTVYNFECSNTQWP